MTPADQAGLLVGWTRVHDGQIAGDGPDRWRWARPDLPGRYTHSSCAVTVDELLSWLTGRGMAVMLVAAGDGIIVATAIGDTPGTGHRAVAATCLSALSHLVLYVNEAQR